MTEIALPISCGFSEREVARRLGTSGRFVAEQLAELRAELERLSC